MLVALGRGKVKAGWRVSFYLLRPAGIMYAVLLPEA